MNVHRQRIFLLILTLLAFGWRMARLDFQSLWRDEVDAIYFAVRNLDETLRMFVQAAQNGPLYFLGLRPWFAVVGTSEFALRFPSVVAGALSTLLVWQVGRRLLPAAPSASMPTTVAWVGVAEIGALFFALNPYQIWYGQEGKMYATVTCLALLSTWLWLRGIEAGGWRWWLAYLLVVSAALYVHLLMVLLIPLHLLWFGIAWPRARHHWRGYGLALAGLTLPYSAHALVALDDAHGAGEAVGLQLYADRCDVERAGAEPCARFYRDHAAVVAGAGLFPVWRRHLIRHDRDRRAHRRVASATSPRRGASPCC